MNASTKIRGSGKLAAKHARWVQEILEKTKGDRVGWESYQIARASILASKVIAAREALEGAQSAHQAWLSLSLYDVGQFHREHEAAEAEGQEAAKAKLVADRQHKAAILDAYRLGKGIITPGAAAVKIYYFFSLGAVVGAIASVLAVHLAGLQNEAWQYLSVTLGIVVGGWCGSKLYDSQFVVDPTMVEQHKDSLQRLTV